MLETVKKDKLTLITTISFLILTIWWLILLFSGSTSGFQNYLYSAVYGPFMSLFGAITGLYTARHWGGWKSVMGRAILMLSFGLFCQAFGQIVFSAYYLVLNIEVPYPSLADIGFWGYMPFYFYGILLLSKVSGVKIRLESFYSVFQAIIIPLGMLSLSYVLFLQNYEFNWTDPLRIFLDFSYPLGQALNVSLAIVTFVLTRNVLGGIMRKRVLIILIAFVAQYVADSNFLYQSLHETWYNAGYGDYLYLIAYTIMTFGLLQLRVTAVQLRTPNTIPEQKA